MNNMFYNIVGDEIRIGWFSNGETLRMTSGTAILIITGQTTENFKQGDVIQFKIKNDPLCEFADGDGEPIDNVVLKTFLIEHSPEKNFDNSISDLNTDLFIFPNPAENVVNIRYNVALDGFVKISLFNVLGEKVIDVVNNYKLKGVYNSEMNPESVPSGVYTCQMVLDGKNVVVRRLVVSK
jgi:hypothetical protein